MQCKCTSIDSIVYSLSCLRLISIKLARTTCLKQSNVQIIEIWEETEFIISNSVGCDKFKVQLISNKK